MITGNQMRLLRTLKNIGQSGLAKMLGLSQQYISKLERYGDTEIPHYWGGKIISILNCSETEVMNVQKITVA